MVLFIPKKIYKVQIYEILFSEKNISKKNRKPDDKAYTPPEKYEDAIEIWTKNTKKDYKRFK